MKILIAPDSFKNALSSIDVANSLRKGISVNKSLNISVQQISDGGEGALNVILENTLFEEETTTVTNPIGKRVIANYAINKKEKSAFIEIAQAAGIELLKNEEQNPLHTTSYGVGEMIVDAFEKGIRHFTLSLGGSATNDGGAGILSALGIQFMGIVNEYVSNSDLANISNISIANLKIQNCKFKILVDVDNPLLGENGATQIYAQQKGAAEDEINTLENNLANFAKVVSKYTGSDYSSIKGSGAAGGIAFGLKSFFDVEIISGITELMKFCNLEGQIKNADLIISGEGSLDSQSQNGKLLSGIANMCHKYGKTFIFVAGKVESIDLNFFFNRGCVAIIPIQEKSQTLKESINRTSIMLENVGVTIAHLFDFSK